MRNLAAAIGLALSMSVCFPGGHAWGQRAIPLAGKHASPNIFVANLEFSPDSHWLATLERVDPAGDPSLPAPTPPEKHISKITIWDVETKNPVRTLTGNEPGGTPMTTQFRFSPDGSVLALAEDRGKVRLWNTATWESSELTVPVVNKSPLKKGKRKGPACTALAFSADSQQLAVCFQYDLNPADNFVWVWDRKKQQETALLPIAKRPVCVALRPENRLAIVVNDSRTDRHQQAELQHWDLPTGKIVQSFPLHRGEGISGQFAPDGSRFAFWNHNQAALSTTGTGTIRPLGSFGNWNGLSTVNYRVGITALAFSTDGEMIAAGGNANQVHTRVGFWNLASQQVPWDQNAIDHGTGYAVTGVAFSPDGKYLATCVYRKDGIGDVLYLWDLRSKAR